MSIFYDGQMFEVTKSYSQLGIEAGDMGVIWATYSIQPPTFEVTTSTASREEYDITLSEDELLSLFSPIAVPSSAKQLLKVKAA